MMKRVAAEDIEKQDGLLKSVLDDIEENGAEYIITLNGEDKAVMVSFAKYNDILNEGKEK